MCSIYYQLQILTVILWKHNLLNSHILWSQVQTPLDFGAYVNICWWFIVTHVSATNKYWKQSQNMHLTSLFPTADGERPKLLLRSGSPYMLMSITTCNIAPSTLQLPCFLKLYFSWIVPRARPDGLCCACFLVFRLCPFRDDTQTSI